MEFLCCCETHSTLNASHRLPSQARASRTNIAYNTNRNRYASAFAVGVHSRYSAMLCRKFGVDVKNFAIDRIPEELAGKSPKEIRAELSKTRSAMSEIGSRVSEEIYRRRADRNKEQER